LEAEETTMVDETKLNAFIGKILGDLGGVFSAPLVRMGDKLGLYKALKEQGPMTPDELAAKTNVAERYAREWLSHQAASGYLEYEPATGKFALPPEQAWCSPSLTVPSICTRPSIWRPSCWKTSRWSRRVPERQRGPLGRSVAVPLLHDWTLLPHGLSQQPRGLVVAGARRRCVETRKRRQSG
jgi:hypothetical protein